MAGNRCVHKNCLNNIKKEKGLRLFRFPSKNSEKWVQNTGNSELLGLSKTVLRRKYVCEAHFRQQDILPSGRLLTGTVPIPYIPTSEDRPTTSDSPPPQVTRSLTSPRRYPSKCSVASAPSCRSMPLKFYYLSLSPPARSVDLVIHALGLSAEYIVVDTLNKEQFKPDFLKLNPLHTIPLIIDDGFVLWESHAIMAYLVSKYGKDDSLYPKDLKKRAIVDQRMHYHNDVFYLLRSIIRKILYGNLRILTDSHIQQVREVQINMEKLLEGSKFMAGDTLTLADYSFITLVDILEVYLPMEDKFPLISAWAQRCQTTMKDFDLVNSQGAHDIVDKIKMALSLHEHF